jgi:hypothetical protein
MRNERNGLQTALSFFAAAVIIAMLMAFLTTFERVDKRTALARPRLVRRASPRLARPSIAHQDNRS